MRNHYVEIADRTGHSFKMHISTVSYFGMIKDGLAGDYDDLDLTMTGLKNDDGKMGHIFTTRSLPGAAWRVVEKGFLRYNSGRVVTKHSKDATTRDVILLNMDGTWGMKLFDYEDALGVNQEGNGTIIQPWVMDMAPGKFSWVMADD